MKLRTIKESNWKEILKKIETENKNVINVKIRVSLRKIKEKKE